MFTVANSIIPAVAFDWRTGTLKHYEHQAYAGEVHFLNEHGQTYDYTTVDCPETIANFATDPECASILVVTAEDTPNEREERALSLALRERELYADCFGV